MYTTLRQLIIMDPSNLEALLCMCDASVRTGSIRCLAFHLLAYLEDVHSIWKIKLSNGSYFSANLVRAYSKAMQDNAKAKQENKNIHGDDCDNCVFYCTGILPPVLLGVKDRSGDYFDCIAPFD